MSHLAKIELEINDLTALDKACKRMGFELMKGQKTYKWYGRWVGDSPLPEGVDKSKLGTCDHAIKVPGASYEVGVLKKDNGKYGLLWDYWGAGGLPEKIGKNGGLLKQAYTLEKAKMESIKKGYFVKEQKLNGKIQLTVEVR